MFFANIGRVSKELTSTLGQLCGGRLDPKAGSLIPSIILELGVLALEMGSQRAHVMMRTCVRGERIQPGIHFKDDNDSSGSYITVDLMMQPCMVRVGDGHEDLDSENVIVKGDVVALKPATGHADGGRSAALQLN